MTPTTDEALRGCARALLLHADAGLRESLAGALRARDVDVVTATDGERGVQVLLEELLRLDVLVADARLPGRDARALLGLVRDAGGERDLAIVVLASGAGRDERAALVALGADAVVDAALPPDAVAAAIEGAVRARRAPAPAARRRRRHAPVRRIRSRVRSGARLACGA